MVNWPLKSTHISLPYD